MKFFQKIDFLIILVKHFSICSYPPAFLLSPTFLLSKLLSTCFVTIPLLMVYFGQILKPFPHLRQMIYCKVCFAFLTSMANIHVIHKTKKLIVYCVSSNKYPRGLFNFEPFRCNAYWRAMFKSVAKVFKSKTNYANKAQYLYHFWVLDTSKTIPLIYRVLYIPKLIRLFSLFYCLCNSSTCILN